MGISGFSTYQFERINRGFSGINLSFLKVFESSREMSDLQSMVSVTPADSHAVRRLGDSEQRVLGRSSWISSHGIWLSIPACQVGAEGSGLSRLMVFITRKSVGFGLINL